MMLQRQAHGHADRGQGSGWRVQWEGYRLLTGLTGLAASHVITSGRYTYRLPLYSCVSLLCSKDGLCRALMHAKSPVKSRFW